MTYTEMKKRVFALIEEYAPDNANLTEDSDLQAKYDGVANQIMYELARIKMIPKYVEIPVKQGKLLKFSDVENRLGYEVYKMGTIGGVANEEKADGTVFKILEDGIAEVDCYVYPERITDANKEKYEYEMSADVLEIMPYGIAADMLKADRSVDFGSVYAKRYEEMKQRIDPSYSTVSAYIDGGFDV